MDKGSRDGGWTVAEHLGREVLRTETGCDLAYGDGMARAWGRSREPLARRGWWSGVAEWWELTDEAGELRLRLRGEGLKWLAEGREQGEEG